MFENLEAETLDQLKTIFLYFTKEELNLHVKNFETSLKFETSENLEVNSFVNWKQTFGVLLKKKNI